MRPSHIDMEVFSTVLPIRHTFLRRPTAPQSAARTLRPIRATRDLAPAAAAALLGAVLAYLLLRHGSINALAEMTQRTVDSRFSFGGIGTYLRNIRDALIPLAVPIAGLSAIGVAFLLFSGDPNARRLGVSIVVALGLAFFSPNIIN